MAAAAAPDAAPHIKYTGIVGVTCSPFLIAHTTSEEGEPSSVCHWQRHTHVHTETNKINALGLALAPGTSAYVNIKYAHALVLAPVQIYAHTDCLNRQVPPH